MERQARKQKYTQDTQTTHSYIILSDERNNTYLQKKQNMLKRNALTEKEKTRKTTEKQSRMKEDNARIFSLLKSIISTFSSHQLEYVIIQQLTLNILPSIWILGIQPGLS